MTEVAGLANPILNSPYDPPGEHFVLGPSGPTGAVKPGRRPSESFIPVPVGRRRRGNAPVLRDDSGEQTGLDFDVTGERREVNSLINDIRSRVDRWRAYGYPGVTPVTRKLLQHWADPTRDDRMLFCQREAAETAIYLAEAAGRKGEPDFRTRIDAENQTHNDGLPRVGLKMATGSGKTVVMAMLIAWHTANKAFSPRDARFTNRFLVVTPGITIRDRLRVILPADSENYYRQRDLVPPDLWPTLADASISIVNYHTFLLRDAKEMRGVAANTRKLLTAGKSVDPFKETEPQMVERVLRDLAGRGKGEIVVLNDEAHHCYQDRPLAADTVLDATTKAEAKDRNEGARVWFRGIRAVARAVGVKAVYDLSATPFYLGGSGYQEGYIFPWVVSDFSLMDAIESGIVKVPRVPTDDDAAGEQPTYLALWDHIGDHLPKRAGRKAQSDAEWTPPKELQGALESLYRSYQRRYAEWQATLEARGEPPPVFIVVCPNTIVSKLVYDWISGVEIEAADGREVLRPGKLDLLSNVADGQWLRRPRTILIDSAQLESGQAMKQDFKDVAAREIDVFKAEFRRRNPGADVDKLTDEDLLREVMNTVGKKGRLGEHVRAVVSVSMLTEGWDTNTVSHILGIRRFGSQLLCEQVVGRGLRRRSYAPNDNGRFEPEYAEVYGVPFAFLPSEKSIAPAPPSRPAIEVRALDERLPLRITFPKVDGYRIEVPEMPVAFDKTDTSTLHVDRELVPTWTETSGLAGGSDRQELERIQHARPQEVAYSVAADVLRRHLPGHDGALKPWLFPAIVDLTKQWLDPESKRVTFAPGTPVGTLLLAEPSAQAAQALFSAIAGYPEARNEILRPILRRYDGEGSTDTVSFVTRKVVIDATKSHVSHVVLDGAKGNSWEQTLAGLLEADDRVAAYVKNDHLGFTIPYLWKGRSHDYWPDFLVRLVDRPGDEHTRTLVVEVSGGRKDQETAAVKARTARDQWCTAVNNHGGFGRWGYVEITSMLGADIALSDAIEALRADAPITGDPERIDYLTGGTS
ncbi:DEAD/DEAH box helicase family protein [Acidiferrimicrobium sp. IK]|uniref:BPTD_3080 family restriction endonuclease n=1 Tax=Acidiferrimicrobium sp. IK TaxID=2871700 RepID=UPI0021CB0611|nr:DEAD/DEAH box helicase family protein [Acidiferrimicrobium sp. IK]MCU4187224.1 DEAD/DEAH box helicase family protein [Acidiferrimicrobium sp. IK]